MFDERRAESELKEEGKDIIKRGKYKTGHQRYYCHHCNTFFMETKGTPLYTWISAPLVTMCSN